MRTTSKLVYLLVLTFICCQSSLADQPFVFDVFGPNFEPVRTCNEMCRYWSETPVVFAVTESTCRVSASTGQVAAARVILSPHVGGPNESSENMINCASNCQAIAMRAHAESCEAAANDLRQQKGADCSNLNTEDVVENETLDPNFKCLSGTDPREKPPQADLPKCSELTYAQQETTQCYDDCNICDDQGNCTMMACAKADPPDGNTEEIAVSSECLYPTEQHNAYEAQFTEDLKACREINAESSTCCNDPVSCMMGGGTVGGTVSGLLQVAPVLATAGATSQANVCKTMKNLTRAGTALNLVASNTCSEKMETCNTSCGNIRLQVEEARNLAAQDQVRFEDNEQHLLEQKTKAENAAATAAAAGDTAGATQKRNEASDLYTASAKCRRNATKSGDQARKYSQYMNQLTNNITQCQGLSIKRDELRTASVVQLGFSEIAAKCEDAVGDTTQDSGGEETVSFNNDCTDARNVNHPICIQCRGTSACSNPVCSGIQLAVACTTTASTDNQRFGNPLDDQTGFGESPDLSRFEDGGSTLSSDPTAVPITQGKGIHTGQGGSGGGGVAAAGGGSTGMGSSNGGGGSSGGSKKPKLTLSERSGGGYSVARGNYGSGGGYSQRGGRGSVTDDDDKKGKGVNLNDLLGKKTNRKVAGLSGGLKSPVHPSHVNIFERIHNRYQIKCKSRLLLGCDGNTASQHEQYYKSNPGR